MDDGSWKTNNNSGIDDVPLPVYRILTEQRQNPPQVSEDFCRVQDKSARKAQHHVDSIC